LLKTTTEYAKREEDRMAANCFGCGILSGNSGAYEQGGTMKISKPVIIADDLTGAMDTGVQLLKKWPDVSVVFDEAYINEISQDCDALVINTESRNTSPEEAGSRVYEFIECLGKSGLELVYKKIDSTLRGNVGKELEVLLHTRLVDLIAFVPALPRNGRKTIKGNHYLNGRLLTESELASDPFSSVNSSYIPDIIGKQTSIKTAVVGLNEIRGGSGGISEVLSVLWYDGCRIIVMDSENEQDMQNIAEALGATSLRVLPCGSTGLFSRMFARERPDRIALEAGERKNDKPLVVLSGSPTEVSKHQIEFSKDQGVNVLKLDRMQILGGMPAFLQEVERVGGLAVKYLQEGRNVVVDGAGEGKKELKQSYLNNPGRLQDDGGLIREALSSIALQIAENTAISGMMIFGGDTALGICKKLGAGAVKILGEVEPLVPFGIFTGGRLDGIPLITKAGGFGAEDIILNMVRIFQNIVAM
jgi:uncharacterized protein YgbK (DUF1537 family)